MSKRLVFGVDDEPIDPTLCISMIRLRRDDVLTETLCLHDRLAHRISGCSGGVDWPGGDRGICPCDRFRKAAGWMEGTG